MLHKKMPPLHIGDLSVPIPIIQGGMGIGISLSGLASAVANAEGIGVISTVGIGLIHSTSQKDYRLNNTNGVKKEIRRARELSSGVIGVNIMTVLSNYEDLVKTSIAEGIDIIFSGAGLPLNLPKYKTADCNTKLVPIVSSGRAAQIIAKKWIQQFNYVPDAFVVEGPKAGGHLGFSIDDLKDDSINLSDLLADVLKVTEKLETEYNRKIPVIVAGGIMTGSDIFEMMEKGASAVQLGSRFIATKECDASEKFKQAVIDVEKDSIKIIKSPVGLPGRAITNDFLTTSKTQGRLSKQCKFHCITSCDPKTTEYCIADALLSAYEGNFENGFVFCGAEAYKIKSMTTVPELFNELITDYHAALERKGDT
jgi:NAD(P)H-dependent flavin oxidoreductase YrpB (nitropropane dioxygenase family)